MTADPVAIPFTMPVALPTVAFAVALLNQVPPPVEFARFVVPPTHNVPSPVFVATEGVTVSTEVATHPPL